MIPKKYPKINTLWMRNPGNKNLIVEGSYSDPAFESIQYWTVSEKIDGTNIRIYWNGETVEFGGRTDRAQIPSDLFNYLNHKFTHELFKQQFPDFTEVLLFGEGYGPKIQKVGEKYRDDPAFILFDVIIGKTWCRPEAVRSIAEDLGLECPHNECDSVFTKEMIVEAVKNRPKSHFSKCELVSEGIIARAYPMLCNAFGTPIMFKLKVSDYDKLEKFENDKRT